MSIVLKKISQKGKAPHLGGAVSAPGLLVFVYFFLEPMCSANLFSKLPLFLLKATRHDFKSLQDADISFPLGSSLLPFPLFPCN